MTASAHSRISAIIATTGRPQEVAWAVHALEAQTRKPERIIISATCEADLPSDTGCAEVLFGPKGLCAQRNTALRAALDASDIIAFFDDDFVPSKFAIARAETFFDENPDVVGATGRLLDDGIKGPGIAHDEARNIVQRSDEVPRLHYSILRDLDGLYGCNMIFRVSAILDARFDESLPLYGWQEDIDFAAQVGRRGRLVATDAWAGVHRGVKTSRTSGVKLGYSQIANPVYLAGKGTMSLKAAGLLAARNLMANHARALYPEPWMDRAGRVRGNWIAIADMVVGRLHPTRILELK